MPPDEAKIADFRDMGDAELVRLDRCRRRATVVRCECGARVVSPWWCHSPWCMDCRTAWRMESLNRIGEAAKAWGETRTIVLTVRNVPQGELSSTMDKIQAAFKRLRSFDVWKKTVTRGIMFWGVRYHGKTGWHPHLHLVVEGEWMDAAALTAAWSLCCEKEGLYSRHTGLALVEPKPGNVERVIDHHLKGTRKAGETSDVGALMLRAHRRGGLEVLGEAIDAFKGRPWYRPFGEGTGKTDKNGRKLPYLLPAKKESLRRALCPLCGKPYRVGPESGWDRVLECWTEELEGAGYGENESGGVFYHWAYDEGKRAKGADPLAGPLPGSAESWANLLHDSPIGPVLLELDMFTSGSPVGAGEG